MFRRVVIGLTVLVGVVVLCLYALGRGALGRHDSEVIEPVEASRSLGPAASVPWAGDPGSVPGPRQILFGDLHVHSTISFDAFMLNLPVTGGQGAATLADACDFARHCAALDFWSINDHASNILPDDWRNTVDAIRLCNDRAGSVANPDTVAFLGWEWTQAGLTPDTHYGHKNVVLRDTQEGRIPARPIAATPGGLANNPPPVLARGLMSLAGPRFRDLSLRWTALGEVPLCGEGPSPELPDGCREVAETPRDLFRKLDEWGHESIVIPHGTAWGIYTPPLSSWDKQLEAGMHDPARQSLFEVYSGHGDSEVYRSWRSLEADGSGGLACPGARADYLPMCERAGQLVEERCRAAGEDAERCAERADQARTHAAGAGVSMQVTVPGATAEDWRDAGQCRDCAQPSFNYRPASSAQYVSALGGFDGPDDAPPRRFRMGFMASSDIHSARPGTGYKELRELSESPDRVRPEVGPVGEFFVGSPEAPVARSRSYEEAAARLSGIQLYESERTRSFLYTGGLIAVHADGRDRDSIWQAMQGRNVYGTSGPRILLWFDLLEDEEEPGEGVLPMGSEVTRRTAPVLRVRAVGSFDQVDGCPDPVHDALGAERVQELCAGQCYRPSDTRRRIERIEVVRIRPQLRPDEDVGSLIDDPWRRFDCAADRRDCEATFRDDEFPSAARDTLYYARVYEEPRPTVNAGTLRCESDGDDPCARTRPCGEGEECLTPHAARAWSSPIWVDFRP